MYGRTGKGSDNVHPGELAGDNCQRCVIIFLLLLVGSFILMGWSLDYRYMRDKSGEEIRV